MKTRLFAFGVACVALLSAARAQTDSAAQTALQNNGQGQSASPSRIIYTQQLPAVADLSRAASAQHQTIQRIEQTANQVVVTYQGTDGQPVVVAYQTISNSNGAATVSASAVATPTSAAPVVGYTAATAPTTVYTPAPTTTVVYSSPGYYDYPYYPYYGYGYGYGYSPVHVNLGFGVGYRGGYGGYGGYHGGYGGGYRGGWHR